VREDVDSYAILDANDFYVCSVPRVRAEADCIVQAVNGYAALLADRDALKVECADTQAALEELLAQTRVGSAVTGISEALETVMRRRYARECDQWKANHEQRKKERDEYKTQYERICVESVRIAADRDSLASQCAELRAALDEACDAWEMWLARVVIPGGIVDKEVRARIAELRSIAAEKAGGK
jgi:hypothetical protein